MVDSVEIAGIRFTGQSGKLPQWATEKSIEDLTDEVKKLIKITLKATGQNSSSSDFVKQNKKLIQSLDKLDGELDDVATRASKLGDSLESNAKKTKKAADEIDSGMKSSKKSLLSLDEPTKKVGGFFTSMKAPLLGTVAALGTVGVAFKIFLNAANQTADSLFNLYNTGVTFEKDLIGLRMAASRAAIPLNDFSKILQDSSAVVTSFGRNGAMQFANIIRQTENLVKTQGFYGMNLEQLAETIGETLEIQRLQGVIEKQNTFKAAQTQANFLKNLTLYSQVLGKSREQILQDIKPIASREDVFAVLQALPQDIRDRATTAFNSSLMAISGIFGEKGQEFGNLFGDLLTRFNKFDSELMQAFAQIDPEMGRNLIEFQENLEAGRVSEDQAREFFVDFAQRLKNLDDVQQQRISQLIKSNQQGAAGARALSALQQQVVSISNETLEKTRKGIADVPGKSSSAIINFRNQIKMFMGSIEEAMAMALLEDPELLNDLSKSINKNLPKIMKGIKEAVEFVIKLFDPKTRDAYLEKVETYFSDAMKSFVDMFFEKMTRAFNETFNPFHRSSEERESQEKMSGLLKEETASQSTTPEMDVYTKALQQALGQEDFVKDFDKNFAYQKLIEEVAKNTDMNLTKILHPAILSSEKFRDTFDKIMANQMPWQKEQAEFSKLGVQSPLDFEIEQMRKQGKWMLPSAPPAGPGPNNLRRNMNLTPEMATSPLVAAPINQNQQDVNAMNQTLGRLAEATEKSNLHLEQIVVEQKRTVGTNRQINRSIEQNANEIR